NAKFLLKVLGELRLCLVRCYLPHVLDERQLAGLIRGKSRYEDVGVRGRTERHMLSEFGGIVQVQCGDHIGRNPPVRYNRVEELPPDHDLHFDVDSASRLIESSQRFDVDRLKWMAVGNRRHQHVRVEIHALRQGESLEQNLTRRCENQLQTEGGTTEMG